MLLVNVFSRPVACLFILLTEPFTELTWSGLRGRRGRSLPAKGDKCPSSVLRFLCHHRVGSWNMLVQSGEDGSPHSSLPFPPFLVVMGSLVLWRLAGVEQSLSKQDLPCQADSFPVLGLQSVSFCGFLLLLLAFLGCLLLSSLRYRRLKENPVNVSLCCSLGPKSLPSRLHFILSVLYVMSRVLVVLSRRCGEYYVYSTLQKWKPLFLFYYFLPSTNFEFIFLFFFQLLKVENLDHLLSTFFSILI